MLLKGIDLWFSLLSISLFFYYKGDDGLIKGIGGDLLLFLKKKLKTIGIKFFIKNLLEFVSEATHSWALVFSCVCLPDSVFSYALVYLGFLYHPDR